MNAEFKLEVDGWLAPDEQCPEFSLTTAEVSIEVNGILATEVEDRASQSIRKSVRISAGLLAQWLLFNSWRLRWEPEREVLGFKTDQAEWLASHSLPGIGHGFVWPLLTLSGDGNRISVTFSKSSFSGELSPVRYLNSYVGSVSVTAFEAAVDAFVLKVLSRLESSGLKDSTLHQLRREIDFERANTRLSSQRKLEAMLGIDPDENPALVKNLLSKWAKKIGRAALNEIAAAQPSAAFIESSLRLAEIAASHSNSVADFSEIYRLRDKIDTGEVLSAVAPWIAARDAAMQARAILGFGSKKVYDRELAALVETTESALKGVATGAPFTFMARKDGSERFALVIGSRHEQNRRFAFARLIADALSNDSDDVWRPATSGNTARQKFQRAFAAEFLCPSDIVAERASHPLSGDGIDDLANEFGVSPWVVSMHLVNRGFAPSTILSTLSH